MKNFLILLCAILLLPFGNALAIDTNNTLTVTVFVQGSFNLMVNSDSFDFARLSPGQTGEMTRAEGISVAGASSGGTPWYLKVTSTKPLSSGSDSIPNENFTWYGTSEGKGEWYGRAEKTFLDPNNTAYISSIEEAEQSNKVTNNFKFKLHVPEDTKAGSYTTTVMFTMTE